MVDGTPRLDGAMLPGHVHKEREQEVEKQMADKANAASTATGASSKAE